jgi:hypothetical protein
MKRTHLVALMVLIVAVPAAAATAFFTPSAAAPKPCFVAGNIGYELTGSAAATFTIRIDNAAAHPSLRIQLVDDPSAADFVLVDDSDTSDTCKDANAINSIRIDAAAAKPDLTVAVSKQAADYKVYVHSASYSEQDAAALFAAIWQDSRKAGLSRREFAATR